jgi:16S rRNA (adenine1518-N6/adenine1519-N6)-dimethyltransferase
MNEDKYFEVIKEYKLMAKHEVGQNFLADPVTAKKIVDLAELSQKDNVLEIGCGAGSLSYFIAESPAKAVLLDIDEALVTKLQHDFSGNKNVKTVMGNVLKHDMTPYTKIIGNLPYYITSAIVEEILLTSKATKAVLMVQKEAYSRLVSKQGDKDYGPLQILLSYRGSTKRNFIVARTNFIPAPHIDSLVFCIDFDSKSDLVTAKHLYALTSALFLHRRKTIFNNMEIYLGDKDKAAKLLSLLAINPLARPEDLSLEQYLSLVHQLY